MYSKKQRIKSAIQQLAPIYKSSEYSDLIVDLSDK